MRAMRIGELFTMKPWFALCFALALVLGTGACGDDGGGSVGNCSFDNCSGCCNGSECVTNSSTDPTFCGQGGSVCRRCNSGDICSAGICVTATDCSQCPNSGCCLGGTQCMEGNTRQACGERGDACVSCSGTEVCDSATNTCVASQCNSATCDGCCTANGECKEAGTVNQSKNACGTGGQACQTCAASDLACTDGMCVPMDADCLDFCTNGCCMGETCVDFITQDNAACGRPAGNTPTDCIACTGEDNCAQGFCEAGPAWVVTIISATFADTDFEGESWDIFGGDPDPKIVGGLGGANPDDFLVPFEDDTLTPVWNYSVGSYRQTDLLNNGLNLEFLDDDSFVDDDMGGCTFTISIDDLNARGKTQLTCGAKATDVTIDFVPAG